MAYMGLCDCSGKETFCMVMLGSQWLGVTSLEMMYIVPIHFRREPVRHTNSMAT